MTENERDEHGNLGHLLARTDENLDRIGIRLTGCQADIQAAHLAKGLEIDRMVINDANDTTCRTEMDRSMVHLARTRAMLRWAVLT